MSIAKNSAYNLLGSVIPMAVGLITVPLYLSYIGIERFGILSICWVMLGQLGFIGLGIGPALAQKLALSKSETADKRAQLFWTGLWLNAAMGLVAALILLPLASYYFDNMKGVPSQLQREIASALPLLAAIIPVAMLSSVLNCALQGRERFFEQNVLAALNSVLISAAPLIAAVLLEPHLSVLLSAALLGRMIYLASLLPACFRSVPLTGMQPVRADLIKPLLSYGGWATGIGLLAPLLGTLDRLLIGLTAGAAAVSVYSIPYHLVERTKVLPQSLVNALFPRFAYVSANEVGRLLLHSVHAIVAIMTPLTVLISAAMGPFLQLWLGPELAGRCAPVAYILLAGFWMSSVARIPFTALQATGRQNVLLGLMLLYLGPYAALLYTCVTSFGVVGAAIAWTVKAFLDPVPLFILTRTAKSVLPVLVVPAAIVCAATATAVLLPSDEPLRWLILSGLNLAAVYIAFRVAPEVIRTNTKRLLQSMTPQSMMRKHGLKTHNESNTGFQAADRERGD